MACIILLWLWFQGSSSRPLQISIIIDLNWMNYEWMSYTSRLRFNFLHLWKSSKISRLHWKEIFKTFILIKDVFLFAPAPNLTVSYAVSKKFGYQFFFKQFLKRWILNNGFESGINVIPLFHFYLLPHWVLKNCTLVRNITKFGYNLCCMQQYQTSDVQVDGDHY